MADELIASIKKHQLVDALESNVKPHLTRFTITLNEWFSRQPYAKLLQAVDSIKVEYTLAQSDWSNPAIRTACFLLAAYNTPSVRPHVFGDVEESDDTEKEVKQKSKKKKSDQTSIEF